MKTPIITLLLVFPLIASAQIDYHENQFDRISNKDSVVRISWTESAPKDSPIYFDHVVYFTNEKGEDLVGSTVFMDMFHNNKIVRTYNFKTADHIKNFITLDKPLKLKEGDKVYFVFRLIPSRKSESYVFNIDPVLVMKNDKINAQLNKKTVIVAKEQPKKEVKHKSYKSNKPSPELRKQRRNNTIYSILSAIAR